MKREIFVGLCGAATIGVIVVVSCGGRVGYPGTLDEGGVYRLDGAFIFGPGSFCASEAGAIYAARPLCKDLIPPDASTATELQICTDWIKSHFPYEVSEGNCDGVPPRCSTTNLNDDAIMDCVPGADGDAYCVAFFQQFVVTGKAVAMCLPCKECAGGGKCQADSRSTGTDCICKQLTSSTRLCVTRDGVSACEDLCMR